MAFVATPLRVFVDPDLYLGRAALFNPIVYAGLAGLGIAAIRRRSAPLFLIAATLYAGWFFSLENVRLLLPAAVVLAPAAADVLVPWVTRWRSSAWATGAALAVPLLLIPLVGVIRAVRYVRDPGAFLYENTQRYADLQWINAHLDPAVHRVGSIFVDVGSDALSGGLPASADHAPAGVAVSSPRRADAIPERRVRQSPRAPRRRALLPCAGHRARDALRNPSMIRTSE